MRYVIFANEIINNYHQPIPWLFRNVGDIFHNSDALTFKYEKKVFMNDEEYIIGFNPGPEKWFIKKIVGNVQMDVMCDINDIGGK